MFINFYYTPLPLPFRQTNYIFFLNKSQRGKNIELRHSISTCLVEITFYLDCLVPSYYIPDYREKIKKKTSVTPKSQLKFLKQFNCSNCCVIEHFNFIHSKHLFSRIASHLKKGKKWKKFWILKLLHRFSI